MVTNIRAAIIASENGADNYYDKKVFSASISLKFNFASLKLGIFTNCSYKCNVCGSWV